MNTLRQLSLVIPFILLSSMLHGQFIPAIPSAGQATMPKGDTETLHIPAGTIIGKGSYKPGSDATVQAIPNPGYEFRHWESPNMEISDPENPKLSFKVDSNKKLKPVFERVWNVIAVSQPKEGGTVTGSGNYPKGSVAKLTAKANEGFIFKGWKGEGLSDTQAKETELTVTGLHDVVAIFQNKNEQQQQQNKDQQQDSQDKQNQDQSKGQQNQQKQEKNSESQKQEQQQEKEKAQPESQKQEEENNTSTPSSDKEETPPQPLYGMTREEALQILDALKEDEKKLPISLMEQSESKKDPSKGRDW